MWGLVIQTKHLVYPERDHQAKSIDTKWYPTIQQFITVQKVMIFSHTPLPSYLSASNLWCIQSREGKGQIRVVEGAGRRILRGGWPVSSVGRVSHQTQLLVVAHTAEQNVLCNLKGLDVNQHVQWWFPVIMWCCCGSLTNWSQYTIRKETQNISGMITWSVIGQVLD